MLSSVAQIDLLTLNDLVAEVKHMLSINQSIKTKPESPCGSTLPAQMSFLQLDLLLIP